MDRFFGLDESASKGKELVLVGTYFDNASLCVAISLLEGADIPYLQKDRGAGGVARIIAGYNMFGADLYVSPENAEAALDLLTPEDDEDPSAPDHTAEPQEEV